MIIKHKREQEKNNRDFLAAIQGIDLNKGQQTETDERLEAVRKRAAARLAGSEEAVENQKLAALGFKIKTVE